MGSKKSEHGGQDTYSKHRYNKPPTGINKKSNQHNYSLRKMEWIQSL